jgi:hypothetical protein
VLPFPVRDSTVYLPVPMFCHETQSLQSRNAVPIPGLPIAIMGSQPLTLFMSKSLIKNIIYTVTRHSLTISLIQYIPILVAQPASFWLM